ncbi:MAG TPA: helix-turn-helix domain-containing protein [Acidimicrobiia bacterium]|nr:helix-turn-helix domain-containing protein [Acidimicrobiia bacterium]
MSERRYSSPLRDSQVQRTRELILGALTALLSERRADEITTREIAERAGVSQPTVYRHFPDRQALLEGLADRIQRGMGDIEGDDTHVVSLDDLVRLVPRHMALADEHAVEAAAEAVFNADPRRYSRASRERSAELRRAVADAFPDLTEREQRRVAALLRSLYSTQTWLRMREEFGVPGSESGPLVAWAIDTLIRELRAGRFPRGERR